MRDVDLDNLDRPDGLSNLARSLSIVWAEVCKGTIALERDGMGQFGRCLAAAATHAEMLENQIFSLQRECGSAEARNRRLMELERQVDVLEQRLAEEGVAIPRGKNVLDFRQHASRRRPMPQPEGAGA